MTKTSSAARVVEYMFHVVELEADDPAVCQKRPSCPEMVALESVVYAHPKTECSGFVLLACVA